MSNIGNYAKHARIWGFYGPDESENLDYWCRYAEQFGKNVLIPMCAVAKNSAYIAKRGFNVTAFDITPEMIEQGQQRFGNVDNLKILQGDIRDFNFDITADFCYCEDLGHIQTLEDIKKAFICINRHLRSGGAFIIITGLREPNEKSESYPMIRFDFGEIKPGVKAWKDSESRIDGENGRNYITQKVYIEENGVTEIFDHAFYLQAYYREEWIDALNECGFKIKNEYGNRDNKLWDKNDNIWIVEAIKI